MVPPRTVIGDASAAQHCRGTEPLWCLGQCGPAALRCGSDARRELATGSCRVARASLERALPPPLQNPGECGQDLSLACGARPAMRSWFLPPRCVPGSRVRWARHAGYVAPAVVDALRNASHVADTDCGVLFRQLCSGSLSQIKQSIKECMNSASPVASGLAILF